ncbi:DUF695 domain-containing protein [Desulfovibrio sp. OttesenSCG-928-G11]|nr:DUF695 domain-containing protein [Desulfovibrio sp. OttesenSCG-928-G11]
MNGNSKDNWELYYRHVEGRPASILLDMGLADLAPRRDFPVLGHVSLTLLAPDDDGLAGVLEYAKLWDMEEALTQAVAEEGPALYAGRCIRNGEADFYFYLPDHSAFGGGVERAMAAFDGYSWSSASTADPDWEVYLNFLYPGPHDILAIQNRRALARLEEMGDKHALPRLVEHWIDCPYAADGEGLVLALRRQGFITERLDPVPDGQEPLNGGSGFGTGAGIVAGTGPWAFSLRLTRQDNLEDIDALVFLLADTAREHGGVYLGWACAATSADPAGDQP